MQRIVISVVAVAGALFLGCGLPCPQVACDCVPPVTVKVTKPGGGSVPGVTLSGAQGSCSEDTSSGVTWCYPSLAAGTTTAFDVTAPGYQPHHLEVTVPKDTGDECSCHCVVNQTFDVELAAQ